MKIDVNILNKIFANQIQKPIRLNSSPGYKPASIYTIQSRSDIRQTNNTCTLKRFKVRNHVIISAESEKALVKV